MKRDEGTVEFELDAFFYKVDVDGLSYAVDNYPIELTDEQCVDDPLLRELQNAVIALKVAQNYFERVSERVRKNYEVEQS